MKRTAILSVLALCLGAAAAYANCGSCPGDKKGDAKTEAPAKGAKMKAPKCGDCAGHKAGKEGEKHDCSGHKADKAKGSKADCPANKADKAGGKKCPVSGASAKEETAQKTAGKKYMCAMKCVETDAPGRCPKCGMKLEEKK